MSRTPKARRRGFWLCRGRWLLWDVKLVCTSITNLESGLGLLILCELIALLQLHRRYFTQAMNSAEPFDMHHEYAPSVLATYLSASSLIAAVEGLFEQETQLSVRFLHFWFNVFSAAVSASALIVS